MLRRIVAANRWAILLTLLLTSLILDALIAQSVGPTRLVQLVALMISVAILVGLIYAVEHPPFVDYIALAVLMAYGVLGIARLYIDLAWIDRALLSLSSLMLLGGGLLVFLQLISPMESDREKLFSAVFGYFLIATLWAYLYWRINSVMPGAIRFPEDGVYGGTTYYYFSLVTLSTLGYGEITPALPLARILAGLQAAFGTLYIAVMIGQIVGRFR